MQRVPFRILAVFLAIVSVAWLLAPVQLAAASSTVPDVDHAAQTGPYATSSGAVNVRGGPGNGFYIIGVLSSGEIVPILAASPDGGWWYVNTRFGEGWVARSAVTAANAGNVPVRNPGPIATVSGILNVRSGAGPNAPRLGQLGRGDQVLVIGQNTDGTWLEIRWAYGTGWISAAHANAPGVAAPTAPQSAVPITADAPFGIVSTAFLNVRSGPGINYASLGRVSGGDTLAILGRSADGAWYQVQSPFGSGWVSARYLTLRNEFGTAPVAAPAADAPVSGPIAIINTGALNVRSGPGAQYTDIGTLAGGDQGRIIGRSADGGWWLIETSFGSGWVSTRFVIARGDTAGVPIVTPGGASTPTDGQGGGEAPAPQLTGPVAFVATGALNIRSGPNSAFSSLGSVPARTRMPIIGQSPDRGWWLVQSPFGNGWVSKLHILVEGNATNVPVVQ